MNNEESARLERCREIARERLSQGLVPGANVAGDVVGFPNEERVEQLALLFFSGEAQ